MYISTNSRSYRQILLNSLKVIGLISIFVAPIALLQVISASKAHNTPEQEHATASRHPDDAAHFTSEWTSGQRSVGQLGELFDINHNQDGTKADGKFVLRLKRQTDDDQPVASTRPSLAQLTAAGTAAGIVMSDQLAAAAAEAHQNPDDADEDDKSDLYPRPDLSALQSHNQQALNQQHTDSFNPEQMPDSMDALMQSEQEDMGADQGDTGAGQSAEQPSASSQVAKDQTNNDDNGDGDDQDDSDAGHQDAAMVPMAELPRSYLPVQSSEFTNSDDGQSNYLSGPVYAGGVSASPMVDSPDDLSAAAGHHYKKKKQKKVKKVIIKKKNKGKKKYKKVKIIKYKKKKKVVKKKKKKPKKHHHHHHDHGKYYMYAKVPKKKSWEFGFKKGNKKHWIERHEKGHKNKFKTKVKWFDKKSKGKGVHIWDYNHHDKKKKHH